MSMRMQTIIELEFDLRYAISEHSALALESKNKIRIRDLATRLAGVQRRLNEQLTKAQGMLNAASFEG